LTDCDFMMSYMFVISIQQDQCELIRDEYLDDLVIAETYLKTNETEYATTLADLNAIITTYQTKVDDYKEKELDEPDTSDYNALIKLQAKEQE
jgi:hypothetical protein